MRTGLTNMVSSPTGRTRRRARPDGRALTSRISSCNSSGFPDRPVVTAGTSADGRVPGVDRRGIAGWSSAAQRPPTSEVPYLLLLIWTTSSPRYRRPYAPDVTGAGSCARGDTNSYCRRHSDPCPVPPARPRLDNPPPGRTGGRSLGRDLDTGPTGRGGTGQGTGAGRRPARRPDCPAGMRVQLDRHGRRLVGRRRPGRRGDRPARHAAGSPRQVVEPTGLRLVPKSCGGEPAGVYWPSEPV